MFFVTEVEVRLIIFFAVEDREALYSQQKQDREQTVPQIMSYLWPNSDLLEESMENQRAIQV